MTSRYLTLLAALPLLLGGCGADEPDAGTVVPETTEEETTDTGTATPEATTGTAAAEDVSVSVAEAGALGPVLVDGEGMTLYVFDPDAQGPSTCYDQCATNWPPLLGDATAGDGADGSLLATAERQDDSQQVTYNGWPLYYFAADSAAGDVKGQGVNDVWWVIGPDGEPITQPPS